MLLKNKFIKKITTIFLILILTNILIYVLSITTSNVIATPLNNESQRNVLLAYENEVLKNNYKLLEKRLQFIENNLKNIDYYDKYIYSHLLDVNIDSIDYTTMLNNASLNSDTINIDSMLINLDRRAIFLSKISSNKLNRFINNAILANDNSIKKYPTISPIHTKDIIEITSGFGWRKHPIYKTPIFHEGIDIATKPYTNIYSTMDGKVIEVKYSVYGYGNKVVIRNTRGFEVLYAHLSDIIYVKRGQRVTKGQIIAKSGNTGTSTGHHLHYEIRKNEELKDPLSFFYSHITNKLIAEYYDNKN